MITVQRKKEKKHRGENCNKKNAVKRLEIAVKDVVGDN